MTEISKTPSTTGHAPATLAPVARATPFNIVVPDEPVYSSFVASGLTHYSRADVLSALTDVVSAYDEYTNAIAAAPVLPQWPDPAFYDDDTPVIAALRPLLDQQIVPVPSWAKGCEYFPIKQWANCARQFRSLASRINKAAAITPSR